MPASTAHGLSYPLSTDPLAGGANAIAALATGLDPAVRTGPLTPGPDWAAPTEVRLYRLGLLCVIHFQARYLGTDVTAPATSANIPDSDVVVAGLPADLVPTNRAYGGTAVSFGHLGGFRVNGTAQTGLVGRIVLATLTPNSVLANGATLDFDIVYPL